MPVSGVQSYLGFAPNGDALHPSRPNRVRRLRTDVSLPVALHDVSQRRSYVQLRDSQVVPIGTSTLLICALRERTRWGVALPRPHTLLQERLFFMPQILNLAEVDRGQEWIFLMNI